MSNQADSSLWDVIVVGAGPVGLLLAGDLAAAGIQPLVLEREPHTIETPKANGVVGRAAVELRRRGLLRRTRLRVMRAPRFAFGPFMLKLGLLHSPLHVLPIPQRQLEKLLGLRATRLGARVLRGHTVTGFEQDDDTVTVRAITAGHETQLRVRYLVGCDGAHSLVRDRLGIAFPGSTSTAITRIAQVTVPVGPATRNAHHLTISGGRRLALFQPNLTECGSVTIAPMDALDHSAPHDLYTVSTHEPRSGAEPTQNLSETELRASLRRILDIDMPFTALHSARSLVTHSRQAQSYRSGRVFLAGDAAHVFSAGGSALNIGMLDAISLAKTLVTAIRNHADADESTLDGYQAKQHPIGRHALTQTRLQHVLGSADESAMALREVFAELLNDRTTVRRIAHMLEN